MANEQPALSSGEYEAVGRALVDMVTACSSLPDTVTVDYQSVDGNDHLGVIPRPGGRYLWRDVVGCFGAQLPFDIVYQCNPVSNAERLSKEEMMNAVADHLETMNYPALSDDRTITKVIMDSTTYRTQAAPDGSVRYVRSGALEYEKS